MPHSSNDEGSLKAKKAGLLLDGLFKLKMDPQQKEFQECKWMANGEEAGSVDAKYDDLFNTMSSSRDYDGMGSGRILRSRGFAEHWKQTLGLAGVTPP